MKFLFKIKENGNERYSYLWNNGKLLGEDIPLNSPFLNEESLIVKEANYQLDSQGFLQEVNPYTNKIETIRPEKVISAQILEEKEIIESDLLPYKWQIEHTNEGYRFITSHNHKSVLYADQESAVNSALDLIKFMFQ